MARAVPDRRSGRLFRSPSGQEELFEKSYEEEVEAQDERPIRCLGMKFISDEARRNHFLRQLRRGLDELHSALEGVSFTSVDDAVLRMTGIKNWPMGGREQLRQLAERMRHVDPSRDLLQRWKDEVGFPYGEIADILNVSDPPYYTACPNPFLGEFVRRHAKPYDPAETYGRKPFAVDVSEGKTDPVYRAHAYHTKVPHLAIVPSILHYTEPGDLVLDGFAGAGMTGVAAQWCGSAPESYREAIDESWAAEGIGRPQWGLRYSIQNDLSPLASFIAANYNVPLDVGAFAEAARDLLDDVEKEIGWMYETLHTDGKTRGRIEYTVWSEVFSCPECTGEIEFVEEALDATTGQVRDTFPCPYCDVELNKDKLERVFQSDIDPATGDIWKHVAFRPSSIRYTVADRTFEKKPGDEELKLLQRIKGLPFPSAVPTNALPLANMYHGSRLGPKGITHVHHFFLPRPTHALAALWRRADAHTEPRIRHMLLYFVEQALWGMSVLARYVPTHYSQVNQYLTGVYYVASQIAEVSPWYILRGKLHRLTQTFRALPFEAGTGCVSTGSTTAPLGIPNDSVDYVFTDPPFGENIYYADLNFLVESWHKVLTNATSEAIVDRFKKKGLPEYQHLMQQCFEQYRRVLKPGRWITVVFHNSKNAVWTAIQEAMLAAGFVVADVRTMDKQQGSYRQVTSTAVKQDLVISAYKPNSGLEERFDLERGTEEGVWDFIRTHLRQLPISVVKDARIEVIIERQPYLLFDRMVAFHVLRNVTVPLSAGEFLAGLAQRFPERDGMVFLSDQVAEYDRRRMAIKEVGQLEIFVIDESSAIQWLRQRLGQKPQTFQEVHPQFLREIAGWQKHEKLPELSEMLEENFLSYDGNGDVPSQIHSYLSSNFKELRNLPKDHPALRARARNRWYVADPRKAGDLEKLRERILLREFDGYRDSAQRKLKLFRLEAMRAGFRRAWQDRNYQTIIAVAQKIPETVLHEDQKLLMWYDQALTRTNAT
jgi:hypothetical protein